MPQVPLFQYSPKSSEANGIRLNPHMFDAEFSATRQLAGSISGAVGAVAELGQTVVRRQDEIKRKTEALADEANLQKMQSDVDAAVASFLQKKENSQVRDYDDWVAQVEDLRKGIAAKYSFASPAAQQHADTLNSRWQKELPVRVFAAANKARIDVARGAFRANLNDAVARGDVDAVGGLIDGAVQSGLVYSEAADAEKSAARRSAFNNAWNASKADPARSADLWFYADKNQLFGKDGLDALFEEVTVRRTNADTKTILKVGEKTGVGAMLAACESDGEPGEAFRASVGLFREMPPAEKAKVLSALAGAAAREERQTIDGFVTDYLHVTKISDVNEQNVKKTEFLNALRLALDSKKISRAAYSKIAAEVKHFTDAFSVLSHEAESPEERARRSHDAVSKYLFFVNAIDYNNPSADGNVAKIQAAAAYCAIASKGSPTMKEQLEGFQRAARERQIGQQKTVFNSWYRNFEQQAATTFGVRDATIGSDAWNKYVAKCATALTVLQAYERQNFKTPPTAEQVAAYMRHLGF